MKENIKSIQNTFDILDLIYDNEAIGVSDLARLSNLPKTTVHRILSTLQNIDVINQREDELYQLGYKLIKYAKGTNEHQSLINICHDKMLEFAKETGETINLGIISNKDVEYIHTCEGDFYSLQPRLQPTSPLYCSAMGKIYMSKWDLEQVKDYYRQDLHTKTINTIVDYDGFIKEKEEILNKGIAYDREEYEYGLTCIASPILNSEDEIIAVLSVSGPTTRLAHKGFDYIEKSIKATSKTLKEII
ncbi:MAG: IclR family transcriptional regulator [Erysipelotrichales bacterium]